MDPREAKLPKWAQEALEEARTRAALAWPGFPDPAPAFTADGASGDATPHSDGFYWQTWLTYGAERSKVERVWVRARIRYSSPQEAERREGFGSRCDGRYYATREEAFQAAAWLEAAAAAKRLRSILAQLEGAAP